MSDESEKRETIILPNDRVRMKKPIFTSGIKISEWTKQADHFSRVTKCYEITFQCEGDAADAFMHEFMTLADKYNLLEMCYYQPESPKKETRFEKTKNFVLKLLQVKA